MSNIPCNGGTYVKAPTSEDLNNIYQSIANVVLGPVATNVTISDTIPSGLSGVSGSVSNDGSQTGQIVSWKLAQIPNGQNVSYDVSGNEPGTYTIVSFSYLHCLHW